MIVYLHSGKILTIITMTNCFNIGEKHLAWSIALIIFIALSFKSNLLYCQSECDPKSIVGAWRSVPSGFDALLGSDRIWCFFNNGTVEFYNLNPLTRKHELAGNAKYRLDNMFQPKKIIIDHGNVSGQAFQGNITSEFTFVILAEDYFIWIPLLGIGEIRYNRVNGVTDPYLVGGTFRGISSREELLAEILKYGPNTSEKTFQYLQNNSLTDLSDALGLKLGAAEKITVSFEI
ncbi:MAG: hypothetical protein ACKV1O_12915 [Saprospiraceae bacterium]